MARKRNCFWLLLILASLSRIFLYAQTTPDRLGKVTDDIERKFTSVGTIGLTVTNFGTIGTRNNSWPRQPSCEYPRGSRIEHVYQGSLWVGALLKTQNPNDSRNNQFLVSTGANDRSSASRRTGEGLELNSEAGDSIVELSALSDDRPSTAAFSPLAVSHQDFVCNYSDLHTRVPSTGDSISNHSPLGISVHQESYAWNFPFADFFVILRYVIKNASADTLDSVYVGMWDNAVVRNTNFVRPGTSGYFNFTGHGFDPLRRLAYSFDFSGQPGGPPADSYIGLQLLGSTPFPSNITSLSDLRLALFYNAWIFRQSGGTAIDAYDSPTDDYNSSPYRSRYSRMTESLPQQYIDRLRVADPLNVTYLLSTGPFSRLAPQDSVEVVFAVVCAKKAGNEPANKDTPDQRKTLYTNTGWAQQAYNGEDANGNNVLDPGEDIARRDSISPTEFGLRYEPDGKVTRYLLPTPPRRPKVHVQVENQNIALYWDRSSAEESVDPISGQKDFEGYRIYRSNAADDFLNNANFALNLTIAGDFDRADDSIGFNTGFSRILLDSAVTFPGDTTAYWYRFPPEGESLRHLNGFQYLYTVTAYDKGDPANNIPSLESTRLLHRIIPGTLATSDPAAPIGVYPNPYYVNAFWDGDRERLRKLYFYNLPEHCRITVFTLAADIVTVLEHDGGSSYGQEIEWFNQFGNPATRAQFAGGEHAWDLISRYDQAIATGLYLFTVEDNDTGLVKRGKFMIVK